MMRKRVKLMLGIAIWMVMGSVVAESYSIPPDKVDVKKVYWGSANNFEKPACVDYERVVRATPEYESIRKNKVETGTAKYWILMSQASDHAIRLISEVGKESEYDFIAAIAFLANLEPAIEADDVTEMVINKIEKA